MAGLFLAVCSSFENAEADVSPVTLQTDMTTADIMTDDGGYNSVVATLTLTNTDSTHYRMMEVYLAVNQSGAAWNWKTEFTDSDYEELENNTVALDRSGSITVKLIIYCVDLCSAGDTHSITVIGNSDPRWYDGGEDSGTTGHPNYGGCQPNCTDHAVPSDLSLSWRNYTNEISIVLTARMAYGSVIGCDAAASTGDNKVYQGNATLWGYTLTNVGWNTDTYQFVSILTSTDGQNVGYWTVNPGMADGKELTGQSNMSSTAVHTAHGAMSIVPANNATSGVYNVELTVTSTNGAPTAGCDFDVVVPGLETEEETAADPANETAEEETEEEIQEEPREVPSISLVPALISIGIIAIFRRK